MKGSLFFGAFALLAFVSCKDIDVPYVPEDTPDGTYDEAWYADNATVSSSDAHFAVTEEGESMISFKAEGGSVVVYVDCGTEWTADDSGAGVFGCEVQETCITVTADQNLAEEELYGTVTLMTAESKIRFATISITQNAYGAPEIKVSTNEWHVPAVAATAEELTTEIGVEANEEWEATTEADWLTAEKGETSVILTVTENETFEERVAEVVLTCTDGYNSDTETITVTQDARAYITLSSEEFEFDKKGGEIEVTVESNYEWSYAYESGWFTVSETTDGSLTITVDVNGTGADREGTVVFTAGDGAVNVAETTLSITQGIEDPDALILEYSITSSNTEIQLPIADIINAEIDWGDGETETTSSDGPSHTYSDIGTYNVSIKGTVKSLNHYIYSSGRSHLTAVIQWGNTGLTSLQYAFRSCKNLASLPDGPGPFSNVTSFYSAFYDCGSLTTVPEDMFSGCTAAEDFEYVFAYCYYLTSAPSFKGLSNATDFNHAFYQCYSLATVPEDMFSGCTAAMNFFDAFCYCYNLTSAPSFKGLSNATNFTEAFYQCYSLATVPEDMFSGCTAAKTFLDAFCYCYNLTAVPSFKELSNATMFVGTFYDCYSLTTVPEDMFSGCTAAEEFISVFSGCTSLKSIPVGIFDNNKLVTDFASAFDGCSNLSGESPYTMIEGNRVHLYERGNYTDYFTAPTTYNKCFGNCTKLDDYDDIPSDWK